MTLSKQTQSRITLLFLALVFIIPMFAAMYLYQHNQRIRQNTLNYGYLFEPPLNFAHLPLGVSWPQHKWWLVYANAKTCSTACQQDLYKMRQVWIALNKDQGRVQRVCLNLYEKQATPILARVKQVYPGMLWLAISSQAWLNFWKTEQGLALNLPDINLGSEKAAFFIIDPLGNLVLAYPATATPRGLYKDLTRLLKVSGIG